MASYTPILTVHFTFDNTKTCQLEFEEGFWPKILFAMLFEIKGAPCTWCAYFGRGLHDFNIMCAPSMCIIFSNLRDLSMMYTPTLGLGACFSEAMHRPNASFQTSISDTAHAL